MKIPPRSLAMVGLPLAVIAALLGWWHVSRQVPASRRQPCRLGVAGRRGPIGLLIVQAVAQMPSEPLGKGGAANSTSASPSR